MVDFVPNLVRRQYMLRVTVTGSDGEEVVICGGPSPDVFRFDGGEQSRAIVVCPQPDGSCIDCPASKER